jgi:hypothetical protein
VSSWRTWSASRRAGGLALLSFLVFSVNMREISSQDTYPTRILPVILLRAGRLDLDDVFRGRPAGQPLPYWVQEIGGHYRPSYPIVPALLAVPVYALPVLAGGGDSWALINLLAKTSASAIAALSVAFVYLALRAIGPDPGAAALALVYAFATSTWSVASQGLWGHGPAELGMAVGLYGALRPDPPRWLMGLAGLGLAVMVSSRTATVLVAGGLLLHLARVERGRSLPTLALFALAFGAVLAHNVAVFGSLQGGYAWLNAHHAQYHRVEGTWSTPLALGLAGILVSPSRGLLVYCPVLVGAAIGAGAWLLRSRRALGAVLVVATAGSLGLTAKFSVWWGGHAFGPRLLTDFLPLFVVLLAPAWAVAGQSRVGRALAGSLVVVSVAVQLVGVFCYPSPRDRDWDWTPQDVDVAHGRLWDWRDPQLLRLARNGPRPLGFWSGPQETP